MKTKTELLESANKEFPEQWEFFRKANPRMRLADIKTFPTVLSLTMGEVTHQYGTEAALTLSVRTESGETVELTGAAFESRHNATCDFSGAPKELKSFAEEFSYHLLFNMMYEEGLTFTDWSSLAD